MAKIAEGGMAGVYRAWDAQLGAWRAIKVLLPEYANRPTLRSRFEREASTMARLSSPHIIRVFDVVHDEALPFMVMELAEGGTLVGWLDAYGRMPASLACEVMEQVATGLSLAHRHGVVHRDIKPHNVLISLDGQCKLTDFGIAQVRVSERAAEMTRTGSTMGTIGYMAPEQRADAKTVDHRADVYSLGAVLFKLITGTIMSDLFLVEHEPVLLEEVPDVLHEVIVRACYHDRERRFPTAEAFMETLRQVRTFLPTDPRDTPPLIIPITDTPTEAGPQPFPEIAVLLDGQGHTPMSVDSLAPTKPKSRPFERRRPSEDDTKVEEPEPDLPPAYTRPVTHPALDMPLYASFPPDTAPDDRGDGAFGDAAFGDGAFDSGFVDTGLVDRGSSDGAYVSFSESDVGSFPPFPSESGSHPAPVTGLHPVSDDDGFAASQVAAQRWAMLMGGVTLLIVLVLFGSTLMVRWTVAEASEAREALYDVLVDEQMILSDLGQAGLDDAALADLHDRYVAFESATDDQRLSRATDYVRALRAAARPLWTKAAPHGLVRARATAIENAYNEAARAHQGAKQALRTPPGRAARWIGIADAP